jgi:cytochrome oxidase Cu insertion factor (SCO1/SenC/PrrC family)
MNAAVSTGRQGWMRRRMIWLAACCWLGMGSVMRGEEAHSHDQFCGAGSLCLFPGGAVTNGAVARKWSAEELLATRWKAPHERTTLNLAYSLTRHDGQTVRLDALKGTPLVVSFAYTRCLNSNKCQAVTAKMGELQRKLSDAGLLKRTRLALITYDAQYDTEETLRTYARQNNLALGERAFFLRPELASSRQLFSDLGVTISFYTSQVNMHEMRLLLIDSEGRLARSYKTVIWDNDDIVKDLRKLLDEKAPHAETTRATVP